jgi:4-hydroxybenzoate polyprenyltransferase
MEKLLKKFYYLNTMGRIEGPPMAGMLLLAGAVFVSPQLSLNIVLAAFCMFFICMNYVYLINGVTDTAEDSINSPERPLSKGVITVREGWIYCQILFGLTVIYPFFLHNSWAERSLVWIILLMGYFYSTPPVRFKRIPILATIYLVINFNLPIILGYWMASESTVLPPFILSTVFLFLANMPLKDYGDRLGDEQAGIKNWVQVAGGTRQLLRLSIGISLLGAIVCFFALPQDLKFRWLWVLLPLLPALNITFHQLLGFNMDKMFTHGVRSLILGAVVFVVGIILG